LVNIQAAYGAGLQQCLTLRTRFVICEAFGLDNIYDLSFFKVTNAEAGVRQGKSGRRPVE